MMKCYVPILYDRIYATRQVTVAATNVDVALAPPPPSPFAADVCVSSVRSAGKAKCNVTSNSLNCVACECITSVGWMGRWDESSLVAFAYRYIQKYRRRRVHVHLCVCMLENNAVNSI